MNFNLILDASSLKYSLFCLKIKVYYKLLKQYYIVMAFIKLLLTRYICTTNVENIL